MRFSLFLLISALLIGCSGEAPPSPEDVAARPAAKKAPEPSSDPVIVTYGDSLTAGYGLRRGEAYPDLLEQELRNRGLRYRVVNEGISGDTTAAGLARIDLAISRRPKYVILAFGANDGLRGLSIERMEENLRRMIERFRGGGATVLMAGMKLPPNFGHEYVSEFDAVYPRVAKEMEVPLMPFLLDGVAAVPSLNQQDGIHPNADGTRKVALAVADFVQPILEKAAD